MQFRKLRLTGFKSFVDPTELTIEPGLTGIVGPNGCGKSNVVEALRWVMGETSAKRMRGGEMDDVIFGGTSARPARNLAEVTIQMDNTERRAPPSFNDSEELEIVRRIERGEGSMYRINGKEVRARDVQLLFADLASGATSTAIVSQGRVGAIIGAKPVERRLLLEEAAGIRGLHSRRHEAELRLKAAEANLERLEDVIGALEGQEQSLQRQVRQATRYRRLSEQIRRFDAIVLYLRWNDAGEALKAAETALREATQAVEERTRLAAGAARVQAEIASKLPGLRQNEAEAAAELQRLLIEQRQLQDEEARVEAALEAVSARLAQIAADAERERALSGDAAAALSRLQEEAQRIEAARAKERPEIEAANTALAQAERVLADKQELLDRTTEEVAAVEAQRAQLARQKQDAANRLQRFAAQKEQIARDRASLAAEIAASEALAAAEARLIAVDEALAASRAASAEAEEALNEARRQENGARASQQAIAEEARRGLQERESAIRVAQIAKEQSVREALQAEEAAFRGLEAEIAALSRALAGSDAGKGRNFPPVLDSLKVKSGYEAALGAALGEDLDAALDPAAASFWGKIALDGQGPALPAGATALLNAVTAPAVLAARLSQIGVVADAAMAQTLAGTLKQGQRLVSRDGGLWRWDGLVRKPGAPSAAAARLESRNRLDALQSKRAEAVESLDRLRKATVEGLNAAKEEAQNALAEARRMADQAQTASRQALEKAQAETRTREEAAKAARQQEQRAFSEAEQLRKEAAGLRAKAQAAQSRLTALGEAEKRLVEDIEAAEADSAGVEQALKVLEDPVQGRERVNRLRAELAELRSSVLEKRGNLDRLRREAELRAERLKAIGQERLGWESRAEGATARIAELEARRKEAEEERARLADRPAEIRAADVKLLDLVQNAEFKRSQAGDALAEGENRQREADLALRETEGLVAQARELRVRREAEQEAANRERQQVAERIAERLDCVPSKVLQAGGIDADEILPPLEDALDRLDKLARERDAMGPVNLRAEQEAEELKEQISSMLREREDLVSAIARLRQGIGALNREGRERLLAAYEKVNAHFKELFVKLFGGGAAELKLTESDDPLQAGLEIMASPPGKKTQIMSLMSGGEQALTALSLLFAVFLTNPAPICVLDEVDAPLDDANVDRFCTMLEEMAAAEATRFLVVTHHRMTMARMDRLFGVTMAERGVSQLVSVDLSAAEALRTA